MTAAVRLPPLKYLEECVRYDPEINKLYWKIRPRKHFHRDSDWKRTNNQHAEKEAFCTLSQTGYLYGALDHKIILAHRLIWKLRTRKEPPPVIDHRDGNKQNNAWKNLRKATHAQNCMNRKQGSRHSGYRGVYPSRNRWMARMNSPHRMYLGTFDTPEEAFIARVAAEQKFYGEFAP